MNGLLICFSIVAIVNVYAHDTDPRSEELKSLKKYEIVTFDYNVANKVGEKTLYFDAFGESYHLLLTPNDRLVGNNIKYTNGIPDQSVGYFSSLTESCHYRVSSLNSQTNNSMHTIIGSVSICNKRGLRGRIHILNDTLIIRPANYYLDLEYDSSEYKFHDISHNHLIYRISEMNSNHSHADSDYPPDPSTSTNQMENDIKNGHLRKLSQTYNSGENHIEMFIFCDETMYKHYLNIYGASTWFEELASEMSDIMNAVSLETEMTDWGSEIGTIYVDFVELEVQTSWNGIYSVLYPDFLDSECTDMYDRDCQIAYKEYLEQFMIWAATYKNMNNEDVVTFDNAQLWTKMNFESDYSGYGWIGGVCRGFWSSSNINYGWTQDFAIRISNHELGHNLNMVHDQDTVCGINGGLMGDGDGTGYSSCSIAALQTYFADNNGLTCLGDGVSSYIESVGDGNEIPSPSTSTQCNDVSETCFTDASAYCNNCIVLSNLVWSDLNNNDFNGEWRVEGCWNDKSYYFKSPFYLFHSESNGNWHIHYRLDDSWANAYCNEDDILDCDNDEWYVLDNAWIQQSNSFTDNDCGPTQAPTQFT